MFVLLGCLLDIFSLAVSIILVSSLRVSVGFLGEGVFSFLGGGGGVFLKLLGLPIVALENLKFLCNISLFIPTGSPFIGV